MKMSLAKKLIIGGIVMVAVPMLVMGWFSYNQASTALQEEAYSFAGSTAQRVADMVQLVMQGEVKIVEEVANSNTAIATAQKVAKDGLAKAEAEIKIMNEMLVRLKKSNMGRDYEIIFLAGMDGKVYADSMGGKLKGLDLSKRDYYPIATSGKVAAGSVVKSKSSGLPVSVVAVPLKDPASGKVISFVGTAINIDFLNKKITNVKLGKTGYPFLVDSKALIIAHPNKKLVLDLNIGKLAGMEAITQKVLGKQTGVEPYVYKGSSKIAGFAPVPLTGWAVVATQNEDEFLADV